MAEADLGKIVGMIMENPELVEKIKAMGTSEEKAAEASDANEEKEVILPKEEAISIPHSQRGAKRNELLRALRSFLSEDRRKSLETMMTIADVLDTMRTK